jgi:U3 small nucleolar RNA-associated protein 10
MSEEDALSNSKHKKKKAKHEDAQVEQKDKLLGPNLWHLRALILESLHKCFLYDNDQKILDSSNFQVCSLHMFPLSLLVPSSSHREIIDPFLDHGCHFFNTCIFVL